MTKLRWLATLMGIAMVGITGFQVYWLRDNYIREKQSLEIKTNAAFRQTILRLQASKLRLDEINITLDSSKKTAGRRVKPDNARSGKIWVTRKDPPITIINLLQEKARYFKANDTGMASRIFISTTDDSMSAKLRDSLTHITPDGFRGNIEGVIVTRDRDSTLASTNTGMRENIAKVRSEGPPPDGRVVIKYSSSNSTGHSSEDVMYERTIPEPVALPRRMPGDSTHNSVFQFLYNVDSLSIRDSVTIKEIDSAFAGRLKEDKMNLAFAVLKLDSSVTKTVVSGNANEVMVGLSKPVTFRLSLTNASSYILNVLRLPILFSLLLVGITIASFVLLYRNLLKQHRLSQIKNDLISNITHELKTPIATVSVAIEALKNFNAIHDPKRTEEYLNISQNELQRLELLVDKVLKLSMFENKQIALQKDMFDLDYLVREVMSSMKFQAEKQRAKLVLETTGTRFMIEADKLHITSVVYNLLDNALKYSGEQAKIHLRLIEHAEHVELQVSDNGIGIPAEYKKRVFDKFFRVPSGDKHTIKGYGLGLSYVDHIVKSHHGYILVESELDKGSTFIVNLPYKEGRDIDFGNGRKIFKKDLKV